MTDKIITDQEILRKISSPTSEQQVIDLDLVNRLRAANDTGWIAGCGLAAIQIGIPLMFAWFKFGDKEFTLLNPVILERKGKFKPIDEGCLSIPGSYATIKRHYKIKYITHGIKKVAKGLKSQIIQHEIDHMNGFLNIDKGVKKIAMGWKA
ncbi:MAG: hypothetical protein HOG03_24120 [Desulfobacula sp.]|jgi:peptide deformylase|uniref:peptide deformylase n=1 Tax=Desulfobacula sp. TaxID=2593537 RepID=UPI001EC1FC45|nr:hypothetical protein [Desulfobacula sp.]